MHRLSGAAAIGTAGLFAVANALWALEQPPRGTTGPELVSFYTDGSDRIVAGGLLSLVAIALLVLFASAFRAVLVELEGNEVLGNLAFGGCLLAAAAGVGAESINLAAALRAGDGQLSRPLAEALFETSYVLGYNAAGIGLGLLALATAAAALRTGALLPPWLAVVGLVLGATLLTPLSVYTLGPSFVYLLVLGVLLLRGSAAPTRLQD